MNQLKDIGLVPPDGYWYRQFETGMKLDGGSLVGTCAAVMLHREANSLARQSPAEVREDVETQICQRSPANFSYGGSLVVDKIGTDELVRGTEALAQWAVAKLTGQDPLVDQAEADRRADICARCFLNAPGTGCRGGPCLDKLRNIMGLTIGNRTTGSDEKLDACRVCGCLNKVQVWYSPEILQKVSTDELNARSAQVPHCWKNDF